MFKKRLNDQHIIKALKQGGYDRERMEYQFYDAYSHYLIKAQRKYRLSEEDAVQAYGDAVISVIHQVINGTFKGQSKLSTYLYQVFQYKCVDLIRKNTTKKNSIAWVHEVPNVSTKVHDALTSMISQEQFEQFSIHLDRLGSSCKQILMAWGEGYSMEEIAQRFQLKDASSAKSRKYKCLQKLKQLLPGKN